MSLQKDIRRYVCEEILMDPSMDIGDDENLLISGILDSLALMRLVMHLEDAHDMEIPPQDITLEHFASLDAMAGYLSARLDHAR